MTRRSIAGLVGAGLLIVLLIGTAFLPVPFVTVSPGSTIDVLGESKGEEIVRVEGAQTFPTDGELRLTTVVITRPEVELSLVQVLGAWMRDNVAIPPREVIYPEPVTTEEERAESAAQMVNAQDTAVAVALQELGYDVTPHLEVTGVIPDGPSKGKLEARDRLVEVAGVRLTSFDDLVDALQRVRPGSTVDVMVRRGDRLKTVAIITEADEDDPQRALLGILVGTGYDLPIDVTVRVDDRIGGPSAGLMFALSVYDVLTPGSLANGSVVAGTGSIAPDGRVGPIGWIGQKIAGAEASGAELFLVPPDNCPAALEAETDDIRLVRADTFRSAVKSLKTYADDPAADLPRCPE